MYNGQKVDEVEIPSPAAVRGRQRRGRSLLEVTLNGQMLDRIDISSPARSSRSLWSTGSSGCQSRAQSPQKGRQSSTGPQYSETDAQRSPSRGRRRHRPDFADALGSLIGIDVAGLTSKSGASSPARSQTSRRERRPVSRPQTPPSTDLRGISRPRDAPTASSLPRPYVTTRIVLSPRTPASSPISRARVTDRFSEGSSDHEGGESWEARDDSYGGLPRSRTANFEIPSKVLQSPFKPRSSPTRSANSSPRPPYRMSPKHLFARIFPGNSQSRDESATRTRPTSDRARTPSSQARTQDPSLQDERKRHSQAAMSNPGSAFPGPLGQGQAYCVVHPTGIPNVYTTTPQPMANGYMPVQLPLHQHIPQQAQQPIFGPGMPVPMPMPACQPGTPMPGLQFPRFVSQTVAPGHSSAPVTPVTPAFPGGADASWGPAGPASGQHDARHSSGYARKSKRQRPRNRASTPSLASASRLGGFDASDTAPEADYSAAGVHAGHFCSGCGQIRSRGYHNHHPIRPGKKSLPNLCGKCRGRIYSEAHKENDGRKVSSKSRDEVSTLRRT